MKLTHLGLAILLPFLQEGLRALILPGHFLIEQISEIVDCG